MITFTYWENVWKRTKSKGKKAREKPMIDQTAPKRLSLSDSALDALLDYTHQMPEEQRFSFLARTINRLSFMQAISDKDVAAAAALVAARLRSLHQNNNQYKEQT
jgi:hypothetical protein